MKNLRISFFAFLLFASAISFNSCNNACSSDNLNAELEKVSAASSEYVSDPSTENCAAYKTALEDYLEFAKGCADVDIDPMRIYSYEAALATLPC